MRSWLFLFVLKIGLLVVTSAGADTIAVIGGKVFTMDKDEAIENASVLIIDGKIAKVGKHLRIPKDALRIDASGKIVTPGFMSSASFLGLTEVLAVAETMDFGAEEIVPGTVFDVSFGINPNSTLIPIVRRGGLTRSVIAPMAGQGPVAGFGALMHLGMGAELITHKRKALFVEMGESGAKLAGGARGAAWVQLNLLFHEAREDQNKRKKDDDKTSIPAFKYSDISAATRVLNKDIPLVVSVDRASDIQHAIDLAEELEIKVIVWGGAESWTLANRLARANIPVILDPTLNYPDLFETLGARSDTAAILNEAGVSLGFSMPRLAGLRNESFSHNADKIRISAGIAVANGLPYFAALQGLTSGAANIWGLENQYGKLKKGFDADIVVWDGDPLEVMTNAETVIIKGRLIPPANRQLLLRDRYLPN